MEDDGRFRYCEDRLQDCSGLKSQFVAEKQLYLLPYGDLPSPDHAFTEKEQDTIEAVARYMAETEYVPALVLASRTKRGREAAGILSAALGREPAVFLERGLHYCTAQDLIERLRCVSNFIPSVLLIAGRRRLEALAVELSGGPARNPRLNELPSGAFVALTLTVESWSAVAPKSGRIEVCVEPDDLDLLDF